MHFRKIAASLACLLAVAMLTSCPPAVPPNPTVSVTGVSLDKASVSLTVGSTGQLSATLSPLGATDESVTWSSSSDAVATVSATGLVTAQAVGTATITVTTTDGGKTASCAVTITSAPVVVAGVKLSTKKHSDVAIGTTRQLVATVSPVTATNQNVTWSSDAVSIATVSDSGLVTAKAEGSAVIKVSTVDGGFTYVCTIEVSATAIPVTGVVISCDELEISRGRNGYLSASIQPINATTRTVTWQSSNPAIATVSTEGYVDGVSTGVATITAISVDGGYTDSCTVTVIAAASSVVINKAAAQIAKGGTEQLSAVVNPADMAGATVSWSTSASSIATVSSSGLIRGIATGTATIYARSGSAQGRCVVTVTNPASGVTLDPASATMTAAATRQLTASVAPLDADDVSVTWETSNANVATVVDGLVTAVGAGDAVITVKTVGGIHSTSCDIRVIAKGLTVTFAGPADEAIDISASAENYLYKYKSPSDVTVATTVFYDSYAWLVDGSVIGYATTSSFTIYASNYEIGIHTLTLIVEKGGAPYSKSVKFRVAVSD